MALSLLDQQLARNASATSTTSASSNSSYKRARTPVPALPASVAWLEHTTLEMTTTLSKKFANCSDTAYVLHVHHRDVAHRQQLAWQVSRPFDAYVDFQQRLLKALALGHACSAECRWLHSFVKNYFPKKSRFFFKCGARAIDVRREKLTRCLNVLKSSLLNRGNHGCAVLLERVAGEVEAFLLGEKRFTHKAACAKLLAARAATSATAAAMVADSDDEDEDELVRRCSIASSMSTTSTDDAGESDRHHLGELESVCDLCDQSLDECVPALAADQPADVLACHTTTLSCGHQFHDVCVLPELAALNYCCPSCNAPQLRSPRQ
ncbi:hypothetical protein PybrP1_011966 [[Pythium] brassicae (nom. inval.)]|nr:hypothetical protein PybrP1_011966 [[Pythium] brassicae (nom. inval.)]